MTNEEIKKMLFNYPKINDWIKEYENDLDNIHEQLDKHYSVNASVISDMPRGTDTSDKTFDKVVAIDKLKSVYIKQANVVADKLTKLYEQKRLVESFLPTLTPTHQFIVEYRYFKNLNWDDVTANDPQKRNKVTLADVENSKLLKVLQSILKEKGEI